MLDFLGTLQRTHTCGQLRAQNAGEAVTLMGWVNRRRDHGNLIFLDLRDRTGITQIVLDKDITPEGHAKGEQVRPDVFIELAEARGFASGITRLVARKAMEEMLPLLENLYLEGKCESESAICFLDVVESRFIVGELGRLSKVRSLKKASLCHWVETKEQYESKLQYLKELGVDVDVQFAPEKLQG